MSSTRPMYHKSILLQVERHLVIFSRGGLQSYYVSLLLNKESSKYLTGRDPICISGIVAIEDCVLVVQDKKKILDLFRLACNPVFSANLFSTLQIYSD